MAANKSSSIEQLLAAHEIVIACGSGGVGKTTTAAAAAAMAAVRHGGKVLVLTVDPAKRLANALGLEGFGNVASRVPDEAFGEILMQGVVPKFPSRDHQVRWAGPARGADNAAVYGEQLGLSQDELDRLAREGII